MKGGSCNTTGYDHTVSVFGGIGQQTANPHMGNVISGNATPGTYAGGRRRRRSSSVKFPGQSIDDSFGKPLGKSLSLGKRVGNRFNFGKSLSKKVSVQSLRKKLLHKTSTKSSSGLRLLRSLQRRKSGGGCGCAAGSLESPGLLTDPSGQVSTGGGRRSRRKTRGRKSRGRKTRGRKTRGRRH